MLTVARSAPRAITASHRLFPVTSSAYDRRRARPAPITMGSPQELRLLTRFWRTSPMRSALSCPTEAANLQSGTFPQALACSSDQPGIRGRRQPNCGSHPATQAALRLQCRVITGRASIPYPTTDDAGLTSVGELALRVPGPRESFLPSRPVPVLTRPGLHQQPNTSTQGEYRISGENK